jgi:hypothetical protein
MEILFLEEKKIEMEILALLPLAISFKVKCCATR